MIANHKDGDKRNNAVSNLEVVNAGKIELEANLPNLCKLCGELAENCRCPRVSSKYTPGPWAVDYEGPCRLAITGPSNESVALCNMQCEDGDVDEANARLIAAAPELLEACRLMLNCSDHPDILEMVDTAAKTAIAKALGAL